MALPMTFCQPQDLGTISAGRDPEIPESSPLLQQPAQDHVQLDFEYLQRMDTTASLHNLS